MNVTLEILDLLSRVSAVEETLTAATGGRAPVGSNPLRRAKTLPSSGRVPFSIVGVDNSTSFSSGEVVVRLRKGRVFGPGGVEYSVTGEGALPTGVEAVGNFYKFTFGGAGIGNSSFVWVLVDYANQTWQLALSETLAFSDQSWYGDTNVLGIPLCYICWEDGVILPEKFRRLHRGDIYLTSNGAGDFNYKRFRLDYNDSTSVYVNEGFFALNGNLGTYAGSPATLTSRVDEAGTPTAFGTGTHYVYLYLKSDGSGYSDPRLAPGSVEIICIGTAPGATGEPDTDMSQRYICLGSFETVAGVVDPTSIDRHWIGDIDIINIVPDGELTPPPAIDIKTLEFGSLGQVQMFDADGELLTGGQTWKGAFGLPYLPKDVAGSGDLGWITLDTMATGSSSYGSIQLNDDLMIQLNYFGDAANHAASVADYTAFPNTYYLVGRDNANADLIYLSLEAFKAYDSLHADTADLATDVTNVPEHALEGHTDYSLTPAGKLTGRLLVCDTDTTWNWAGAGDPAFPLDSRFWARTTYVALDDGSYYTSGEVRANDFAIADDETNNYWHDGNGATVFRCGDANSYMYLGSLLDLQHANEVVLTSLTSYVNLNPSGDLQINGTPGESPGGFTKGLLTDTAGFEASVKDIVEMYL